VFCKSLLIDVSFSVTLSENVRSLSMIKNVFNIFSIFDVCTQFPHFFFLLFEHYSVFSKFSRSIFDFELIRKLISSPNFTFW
jgi:hypothetical protein